MNTRSNTLAGSTRSIRFRRMISPLLSASLAVAVGSACSGNTPTNEPTEVTESAIRNGTIAYPFDANSPTAEAQSVIDLGCTGTLVDQNWVLTAAHCNVAVGRKVTARRPAGNITRTVDGVYTHPATDAALLHLDRAITDVTPATLYTGTMDSLINASMTCYGYGAKTATAPCTTDANCGGNSCWQGHCLTPSAELRYGTNFVVASVDTYGFYYPGNAQTQMLLPGDSGGPCFLGGQQVGINTNDWLTAPSTGNNRDTGIPAILPWIQQTINGVGFVPGYPRIGELRNNYDGTASFFVKEGQAFSDWVTEHDSVISGALSGTRIAVLTADHHCLVRDGNLTEGYWVDEWTAGGINQCVIAGNRIGILRNDGHFLVKEGDLYADWVDEWTAGGVTQGALSGNRIGIMLNGHFMVKEGDLYAGWVDEWTAGGVTQGTLSGNRIGIMLNGHFMVKEGGLYAGWVDEWTAGGVTQGVLSGNRIGIMLNGHFMVKEGGLYTDWVDQWTAGGVAQAALSGDRIGIVYGYQKDNNWYVGHLVKEGGLYAGWASMETDWLWGLESVLPVK